MLKEPAMGEKGFRFDLFVALFALLISAIAAGASAYQTYVIRQQYSATVWPYLTFVTTSSTDNYFVLKVNNVGIGPALIRTAVVTRDGRPIDTPTNPTTAPAIMKAIDPERQAAKEDEARAHAHGATSVTVSSIVRGDVIPAGNMLELLRVDGKYLTRRMLADARRFDLRLCYCSLLGTCWTKRLWDPSAEPHAVAACSDA